LRSSGVITGKSNMVISQPILKGELFTPPR
jgi:hypothetical protein